MPRWTSQYMHECYSSSEVGVKRIGKSPLCQGQQNASERAEGIFLGIGNDISRGTELRVKANMVNNPVLRTLAEMVLYVAGGTEGRIL